jgi:hypothetical protein
MGGGAQESVSFCPARIRLTSLHLALWAAVLFAEWHALVSLAINMLSWNGLWMEKVMSQFLEASFGSI